MNKLANKHSYRRILYERYVSKRNQQRNAPICEKSYSRWRDAALVRFKGWLPNDHSASILDLACGHGNFLYLLEQAGYTNLMGVDVSSEQLDLAARHCSRATLIQADLIEFLSKNQKRFDLISCLNILEHFDKQELFVLLRLIANALNPGGRVIIETPNGESPWIGAVAYSDLTHEWFFTPRSLADTLSQVELLEFEARPSAPQARGFKSFLRVLLWQGFNTLLTLWNLAETGSRGSGIYTRVFVAAAVKRGD